MFKRIALAVVAAVGISGAAQAQPAPVFNWSGFYIGASVGYADAPVDWQYYGIPQTTGYFRSRTQSPTFGGQIGYNWQRGNLVYGIEASLTGPMLKAKQCDAPIFCPAFQSTVQFNTLLTVGPRLGFVMDNGWLPYVSGGVAAAQVRTAFHATGFPNATASTSDYHYGWFVGAGIDYAWTKNIIIGLEYQHVELGGELHSNTPIPAVGSARYISPSADIVRIKLSLKELPKW